MLTNNCPTVTRALGEFLRRCGWLASKAAPSEHGSETGVVDSIDSTDQLVVGSCQLSTVLQIVEDVEFSDHSVLSKWHIPIGRKDLKALQRCAWDSDICYLSASPELGEMHSLKQHPGI